MNRTPRIILVNNKGRCIIATRDYYSKTVILINPVLLIEVDALAESSSFNAYPIRWTDTHNSIALGLINLLNHSEQPNCELICNYDDLTITLRAITDIKSGEELVIKYACELWFEPIKNI